MDPRSRQAHQQSWYDCRDRNQSRRRNHRRRVVGSSRRLDKVWRLTRFMAFAGLVLAALACHDGAVEPHVVKTSPALVEIAPRALGLSTNSACAIVSGRTVCWGTDPFCAFSG